MIMSVFDNRLLTMCSAYDFILLNKEKEQDHDEYKFKQQYVKGAAIEEDIYGFLFFIYNTADFAEKSINCTLDGEDVGLRYSNFSGDYGKVGKLYVGAFRGRNICMTITLKNPHKKIIIKKYFNARILYVNYCNVDKFELWLNDMRQNYTYNRFANGLCRSLYAIEHYTKATREEYIPAWLLVTKLISLTGKEYKLFYANNIVHLEKYFEKMSSTKKY